MLPFLFFFALRFDKSIFFIIVTLPFLKGGAMRQIILSPEFQLLSPFFVVFVLILIVNVVHLILRIMKIYNEVKSRKLLEKFFNEVNGGDTMEDLDGRTMFQQALDGVTPTIGSGNRREQTRGYAQIMQLFDGLETGAVQKIRRGSRIKATLVEMQHSKELLQSADAYIEVLQGQFDKKSPSQVAEALGNEAPEQNSLDAPPVDEKKPEISAPTEVPTNTDASAGSSAPAEVHVNAEVPTSTDASAGSSAPTEVQPNTEAPMTAHEAIPLLKENRVVQHLLEDYGINPNGLGIQDLHNSLLEKLIKHFDEKVSKTIGNQKICSKDDERIFTFLCQLPA